MSDLKIKAKCEICSIDDWESLDYLRETEQWYYQDYLEDDEPVGFKVCKNCSFITYDYVDPKRLAERYDRQRPAFQPDNIITCNRKNKYHELFLDDTGILPGLTDNAEGEPPDFKVLDIGAAQGYFLEWLYLNYDIEKDNLHGTEYSKSYRQFGRHEYGLNLQADITDEMAKTKYDLISYFHVLEHIQYPKKELEKVKKMLKPGGYIYISVPTWLFNSYLQNSAQEPMQSFEHYYHLNHVCVFTENSFKNLLKSAGLKAIKYDKVIYGHTVLCRVDESEKDKPFDVDDIDEIKKELEAQKLAIEAFLVKDYEAAIKVYPRFPEAYSQKSVSQDNIKELERQKVQLERGLEVMPKSITLLEQYATLFYQFDENKPDKVRFYSNNIKKSEKLFLELSKIHGNDKCDFFLGMINGIYKKDYKKAVEYIKRSLEVNPTMFMQNWKWIGAFYREME